MVCCFWWWQNFWHFYILCIFSIVFFSTIYFPIINLFKIPFFVKDNNGEFHVFFLPFKKIDNFFVKLIWKKHNPLQTVHSSIAHAAYQDIHTMLGFYPGLYWRVCWTCCPVFIGIIFILALWSTSLSPMEIPNYTYPAWSVPLGWVFRLLSCMSVPAYMLYMLCTTPGPILKVFAEFDFFWEIHFLNRIISIEQFSKKILNYINKIKINKKNNQKKIKHNIFFPAIQADGDAPVEGILFHRPFHHHIE